MEQKKVLQLCLSPSWGGLEMVAYEMAQQLAEQGRPCVTVTCHNSRLAEKMTEQGLPVLSIPSSKHFSFAAAMKLREILKSENIQTILVQHLRDLGSLRVALLGLSYIRVIGFSHTFVGVSKKDFLHSWMYRRLNTLLALTPSHQRNLLEYVPVTKDQMDIVPNSVDTVQFSPGKRSEKIRQEFLSTTQDFLVSLVGRLDKGKGQRYLIEAANILVNQGARNFKVLLVGEETRNEPGELKVLSDMVRRYNLEDYIVFTGFRSDIPELVASSDALVMASDAETFGRVLIEGMACGVPVIGTNAGGVCDIIENEKTGLLVPPKNGKALAFALEDLMTKPELRKRIADAGLQKALEVYSRPVVNKKLEQIFFQETVH